MIIDGGCAQCKTDAVEVDDTCACRFDYGWLSLRIIWSKMGECNYYGKKFYYRPNFDNEFMKVAR